MNKRDKIDHILALVKEQTEEFLELEDLAGISDLSASELVVAAVEIVTTNIVTTVHYISPVGQVDRSNVSFMIDDELEVPIYSTEHEDSDD
jgi:hypothetical protein